jgi:hypothetical protein
LIAIPRAAGWNNLLHQQLCPRSPWQHPPWTRVTAPHLPMSPVQALGGAARSHRSRSPCFGRQKGTLR